MQAYRQNRTTNWDQAMTLDTLPVTASPLDVVYSCSRSILPDSALELQSKTRYSSHLLEVVRRSASSFPVYAEPTINHLTWPLTRVSSFPPAELPRLARTRASTLSRISASMSSLSSSYDAPLRSRTDRKAIFNAYWGEAFIVDHTYAHESLEDHYFFH